MHRNRLQLFSSDLEQEGGLGAAPTLGLSQEVEMETNTFLARAVYDFNLPAAPKWRPYIGGGIGFVAAESDSIFTTAGAVFAVDDTVFAGEVSGGVSYALQPDLDLYTDVRYLIADDLDVERNAAITPLIQDGEAEIDSVSINFGIRYRFP